MSAVSGGRDFSFWNGGGASAGSRALCVVRHMQSDADTPPCASDLPVPWSRAAAHPLCTGSRPSSPKSLPECQARRPCRPPVRLVAGAGAAVASMHSTAAVSMAGSQRPVVVVKVHWGGVSRELLSGVGWWRLVDLQLRCGAAVLLQAEERH